MYNFSSDAHLKQVETPIHSHKHKIAYDNVNSFLRAKAAILL